MNILQVTPFDTYPPKTGSEQRAHGIVSYFPEMGDEVRRFSQALRKSTIKNGDFRKRVSISESYTEHRSRSPMYEFCRFVTSYLLRKNSMTYFGDMLERYQIEKFSELTEWADIVLVRGMWQVQGLKRASDAPVVFSNHRLIKHQHESYRSESSTLFEITGKPLRGMRDIERNAVKSADAIICHSEHEKKGLVEEYNPSVPIFIAPAAIPPENLKSSAKATDQSEVRETFDANHLSIFMGAGTHRHNRKAAQACIDIVEEINKAGFDTHLLILGKVGDHVNVQNSEWATTTGFVEDIGPYLNAADFALNPIDGKGVNVKMLDYFAQKLPVVTTPEGTSGFDLVDGEQVIIAERNEMSSAIANLLSDEELIQEIGHSGYQFVKNNHTWPKISEKLGFELHEWLSIPVDE